MPHPAKGRRSLQIPVDDIDLVLVDMLRTHAACGGQPVSRGDYMLKLLKREARRLAVPVPAKKRKNST